MNNSESNRETKNTGFRLWHWQKVTLLLVAYDILAVNAAYFGALWLRFDLRYTAIPQSYLEAYLHFA